jgi:Sec-independent protein translocase protein TatA
MPTDHQFSQEMKQIFFNVIKFVEKEMFGPVIPLLSINERLSAILDISMRSVERLKSEMREIEHDMMERKRKMDEQKEEMKNQKIQVLSRFRKLRSRSPSSSSSSTISTNIIAINNLGPRSPLKLSNSGRPSTILTEQQETIR